MIERTVHESLGTRKFRVSDIEEVLHFFKMPKPVCVYCGSQDVKRWDHLVAVMQGGETVLGNMVPACQACDDSKRDRPVEEWLPPHLRKLGEVDPAVIDERLRRLRSYVEHFGYRVVPLAERLTTDEFTQLQTIREEARKLRVQMDALFHDYKERVRVAVPK